MPVPDDSEAYEVYRTSEGSDVSRVRSIDINNPNFVHDASGTFWGLYGAAGVLLRCPDHNGNPLVLLQHRATWGHMGDTWGLPGGARNVDESSVAAALRELNEETGIESSDISVCGEEVTFTSASGWTYTTVYACAAEKLSLHKDVESQELRWVLEVDVAAYPLHPGLKNSWPLLQVDIITDASTPQMPQFLPFSWSNDKKIWYKTPPR